MDEYIDRSIAVKGLRMAHDDDAAEFVRLIPAADVVPVRHGRWRWELADNGWANHICSNCGYTKNTDVHVAMDYRYCPNCGARMDLVTDCDQVKDGDGE